MDIDLVREKCEADLLNFIKVLAPHRVLGSVHEELIKFWTRPTAKKNQLALIPRAHQKSAMAAYWTAWQITRNPATTIMYVSATINLAEKQVKAIKDILSSPIYKKLWPTMINPEEGKREKWTALEVSVDDIRRKEEGVRDPTLWATGVGGTQTGMHSDIIVYDDLVVPENAYTEDGRRQVGAKYSQMASIANPDSKKLVVGTRYHPKDIYNTLMGMEKPEFKKGKPTGKTVKVYEIFEAQVEDQGDGFGEFLWPKQQRKDGSWFGFDAEILAGIKAEYIDRGQFRAQYYNDPNDSEDTPIPRNSWGVYDRKNISVSNGVTYFKDTKLNVFAAVDFAFSRTKRADWTSVVVVGVDSDNNYFVLDIDRFKTDKITDYFHAIEDMWTKWRFKKIRCEAVVAQMAVVDSLKDMIKEEGMLLSVDIYKPTRHEGNKYERIQSILEPRYANGQMYHYAGGNCQILEEELVQRNPAHDDCKDALAAAVDLAKPPKKSFRRSHSLGNNIVTHKRFGGIAR